MLLVAPGFAFVWFSISFFADASEGWLLLSVASMAIGVFLFRLSGRYLEESWLRAMIWPVLILALAAAPVGLFWLSAR
jgi:hypothetical protein